MKKIELILALVLSVLLIIFSWIAYQGNTPQPNLDGYQTKDSVTQQLYQNLSDDQGDVSVKVQPMVLKSGSAAKFSVQVDTHTVELDYDLISLSTITDGQGQILKATSWSGGRGGHHLVGELNFPPISRRATSVKLTILKISGTDRVFKWDIKG